MYSVLTTVQCLVVVVVVVFILFTHSLLSVTQRRDRDYRGGDRLPPPRGGPDDGEYYRRDDYRGDRGYR